MRGDYKRVDLFGARLVVELKRKTLLQQRHHHGPALVSRQLLVAGRLIRIHLRLDVVALRMQPRWLVQDAIVGQTESLVNDHGQRNTCQRDSIRGGEKGHPWNADGIVRSYRSHSEGE